MKRVFSFPPAGCCDSEEYSESDMGALVTGKAGFAIRTEGGQAWGGRDKSGPTFICAWRHDHSSSPEACCQGNNMMLDGQGKRLQPSL